MRHTVGYPSDGFLFHFRASGPDSRASLRSSKRGDFDVPWRRVTRLQ